MRLTPFLPDALSDTLFTIGAELLIVLAFLHMISARRSPSSMIAWTLAIFLVPYAAVPFYFLFGHRKLIKRYQKLQYLLRPVDRGLSLCNHPVERLLYTNGIPPATSQNRFGLRDTPEDARRELLAQIDGARQSIDICVYELVLDESTLPLMERLKRRAKEGVRVRILMDSIGSAKLYLLSRHLKEYRASGIEIAFFMPFLRFPFRNFINLRNHRKIYIFDQKTALSGGMNLTGEYLSADPQEILYTDFLCLIEGRAAHYYLQIFEMDWAFATHTPAKLPEAADTSFGTACIQVAPSGPDTPSDGVVEALLSAICNASRRIWIFTPYFVPTEEFVRALTIALHRGVELKIVIPERSDHLVSDLGRGSYLRELSSKGAAILLHRGKVLHAKAMVFDDDAAIVGTINFDNRSLFYNFEVVSLLYSRNEIETIVSWGERVIQACRPYRPTETLFQVRIENLMRMLSPLV
ncbi:phospholipase D-like domain-containing protein [Hydrogenimonas urashimensis]|uniref:phospholipase D-like domain-containing protein n=1 Tax=Hydrogenimonas urashimensis TaxID=2740515 RepID=UPI0019168C59|nr:phospholipase D-like domain-containing protein [Hydrogenimonas urashimensis]